MREGADDAEGRVARRGGPLRSSGWALPVQSRHRAVKNLDLADELDDNYDDGDDYLQDMTSEQQAQMADAFAQVQSVLGTDTAIADSSIRDALWDSYFDVDGTIAHLLDEQHKKEARRQKEEGEDGLSPSAASLSLGGSGSRVESASVGEQEAAAAAAPPTASLASLSLDSTSSSTAAPPPPAPKNKLAAKMAANRAAKAAASAPPAPSSTSAPAAPPEKKLSKLQQKMLSARSARTQPDASAPPPVNDAPAPGAPAVEPQPEPMSVDEPSSGLFGAPPALVAAPSSFASALAPSSSLGSGAVPLARRLATSISVTGGVAPTQVGAFGPSPDDKVLEARRGTALGGAAGAAKVPVRR
ncbi:hypothetical protein JCM8208_000790 [Rhodotorula glutinis]